MKTVSRQQSRKKMYLLKFLASIFMILILTILSLYSKGQNCKAAFSFSQDSLNPQHFYFTNNSIGGSGMLYSWYFGDGNNSSLKDPDHTYSSGGVYTVTLYIQDSLSSCWDSTSAYVSVKGCSVAFQYYPDSSGLTYHFFSYVNPAGGSYYWDFGDSTASNAENPVHTFATADSFRVCLTYTNGACTNTYCQTIYLQTCKAKFSYKNQGNTYSFTNESAGGKQYLWNFGDGSTSTLKDPVHTYATGSYYVCLTISDSATSCYDQSCTYLGVGGVSCNAGFNYVPDSLKAYTYAFYNYSWGANLSYLWDFGDSTTSASQSPVHTFPGKGQYNVCLTIKDSINGCSDKQCYMVWVIDPNCHSGFFYSIDSTNSAIVHFYNQSSGSNLIYQWSFGDGATSSLENPVHIYANSGYYQVCLTIKGDSACTDSYCTYVQIYNPACNAAFSAYPDSTNAGLYYFYNQSPAGTKYLWTFGDGDSSTSVNPDHLYKNPGTYMVCLTVRKDSCKDTSCDSVVVSKAINKIDMISLENIMQIFPNPAKNLINIKADDEGTYRIRLIDLLGRERLNVFLNMNKAQAEKIDIRGLENGIYLIQAENKGRIYYGRIVVSD